MNYKYDTAISFAEEDRQIALTIGSMLKSHGLKVYYYPESQGEVIGKELSMELQRIYQYESASAIAVCSKNYLIKHWARHELKAILERRKYYPSYLIPIKLDDVKLDDIEGLSEQIGYHQWNGDVRSLLEIIPGEKKIMTPPSDQQTSNTTKISSLKNNGIVIGNMKSGTIHVTPKSDE